MPLRSRDWQKILLTTLRVDNIEVPRTTSSVRRNSPPLTSSPLIPNHTSVVTFRPPHLPKQESNGQSFSWVKSRVNSSTKPSISLTTPLQM